jgi:hypothetical protein
VSEPHPVEEAVARVKSLAVALRDQRFNHMPLVTPKHYPDLAADLDALLSALERQKEALTWIGAFAEIRSKDDSKTFARVNRGALRNICDRARSALGGQHG